MTRNLAAAVVVVVVIIIVVDVGSISHIHSKAIVVEVPTIVPILATILQEKVANFLSASDGAFSLLRSAAGGAFRTGTAFFFTLTLTATIRRCVSTGRPTLMRTLAGCARRASCAIARRRNTANATRALTTIKAARRTGDADSVETDSR